MDKKSSNTFCYSLIILMVIFMIAGVVCLAAAALLVNVWLLLCAFASWTVSGILLLVHTLACKL